jgi:hypothetical protein
MGSTGDPPVPTGDPPVGTEWRPEFFRTAVFMTKLLSIPLGRWPNGTGKLPVPPWSISGLIRLFSPERGVSASGNREHTQEHKANTNG